MWSNRSSPCAASTFAAGRSPRTCRCHLPRSVASCARCASPGCAISVRPGPLRSRSPRERVLSQVSHFAHATERARYPPPAPIWRCAIRSARSVFNKHARFNVIRGQWLILNHRPSSRCPRCGKSPRRLAIAGSRRSRRACHVAARWLDRLSVGSWRNSFSARARTCPAAGAIAARCGELKLKDCKAAPCTA